jgi:hypothetical protein
MKASFWLAGSLSAVLMRSKPQSGVGPRSARTGNRRFSLNYIRCPATLLLDGDLALDTERHHHRRVSSSGASCDTSVLPVEAIRHANRVAGDWS